MKRKRLIWRLYPWNLVVILASLFVFAALMIAIFRDHLYDQRVAFLDHFSRLLEKNLPAWEDPRFPAKARELCVQFGEISALHFRLHTLEGRVLCDSAGDFSEASVGQGQSGKRIYFRQTEGKRKILVVSRPLVADGQVYGILETSARLRPWGGKKPRIWWKLSGLGVAIAGVASLVSLLATRWIAKPVEVIKRGAERLASGDLQYRLAVPNSEELGSLADTLNQMAARLERLEAVRREFVANVSHELKTPIASIVGFVETLIHRPPKEPEDLARFLEIIRKDAERLDAIINNLLHLSQIEDETATSRLDFQESSVREVLASAVETSQVKAKEKHISIDLSAPQDLRIVMNPHLLEQAVVNLLSNAIAHSQPNQRVEVTASGDADRAVIQVQDHGCGIEDEHLPRLFERFYRVDKGRSRKQGGTGLGLAIVKHIAQIHHGTVEVKSAPGEGSLFSIQVPRHGRG